ncbi:xanthine dehydrogenase small subunit [Marinibacterium profundimaris]|uniref:FAD-binding molybdopterin dehydrogenase n=1 Tax=Marinibacterium profundimaris TaxID=1679460 RepID=A0A225NDQ7_9RHOB|nr:xanthine dehydrogenase small subunit [Marinibacterium profundimaris]OWU70361.1 FAD-binding molybdopterin dehydrogenase [Marinibacterium profundimaris]
MKITFRLNGETVTLGNAPVTATLLDWLREERRLTGTKEGCNEGDCGACSVIVTDEAGARTLNACILFLPQLDGKAVRTVEGLSGPDGTLHPVQQAMVSHHGSQCGFCTPGFLASMACAHLNGQTDHDDRLAGNLCRCTGYAPIIRAAEAAASAPVPEWMHDTAPTAEGASEYAPGNADELARIYQAEPKATLVAGATDVGLWVTKQLRDIAPVIFLNRCADLKTVEVTETGVRAGAMVDMEQWRAAMAPLHPSYAEMLRRYGSVQVRGAATLGGNIANGSPIGDNPPVLIALGATLHLRKGDDRRAMPLEEFFLDYGRQDRDPGEFVEAVSFPRQADTLRVYKLSKRFDQDISAVCGAFNITVESGRVTDARIAFGGMAGVPKRASHTEMALRDTPWTADSIDTARAALERDFQPMDDMRASAAYRLDAAGAMLQRHFADSQGLVTSVLEVRA